MWLTSPSSAKWEAERKQRENCGLAYHRCFPHIPSQILALVIALSSFMAALTGLAITDLYKQKPCSNARVTFGCEASEYRGPAVSLVLGAAVDTRFHESARSITRIALVWLIFVHAAAVGMCLPCPACNWVQQHTGQHDPPVYLSGSPWCT